MCTHADGDEEQKQKAKEIGGWLAGEGVHLLTGGGQGLLSVVSQAFYDVPGRHGLIIGIIPAEERNTTAAEADFLKPKEHYPNEWVELPIYTHLYKSGREGGNDDLSRNHINVLTSNVIICLPGYGWGTTRELELAVKYKPKAVVAYFDRPAQGAVHQHAVVSNLPIKFRNNLRELQKTVREILQTAAAAKTTKR
jgi:predicted Rossmann-fold nucleotide-binding protein